MAKNGEVMSRLVPFLFVLFLVVGISAAGGYILRKNTSTSQENPSENGQNAQRGGGGGNMF
jgi:F0F1-type ATP synthase assembly protein I